MVQTVPATSYYSDYPDSYRDAIPFPKFLALLVKLLGGEAKILGV